MTFKFSRGTTFVLLVFILWRLFLFLSEYLGFLTLPFKESFPYVNTILVLTGLPQWVWQWGNFDGVHYLTLANSGYDGFGTQVFFPLYPFLVGVLGRLVGNFLLPALAISHVSLLMASVLLFRLVEKNFDKKIAVWSVRFLYFSPLSFFFASVYTEALFLLLVLGAFSYPAIKSGLFSLAAGSTRLVGVLLAPALLWQRPRSWWGLAAVGGLAAYSVYLGLRFGNPLFFLSAQSAFGNARAFSLDSLVTPPQVVFRYLKIFASASFNHYNYWVALLEFSAFLLGLAALLYLSRRTLLPRSWLVFSWLAFLVPTFSGTFSSLPRYLLTIFPLYVGLALIQNETVKRGVLLLFIVLLALFTALFTRGYWVA